MHLQSRGNVRRRGVILTIEGLRKLNQARAEVEFEHSFQRYTLENLSEETGLSPTTLSKVFTGSSAVDKQTLKCCFDAFNLTLLEEDYIYRSPHQDNLAENGLTSPVKNCCCIESAKDSSCMMHSKHRNSTQTHTMNQPQEELQLRYLNLPVGQMPLNSVFYLERPILESLCYQIIEQPGAMVNIRAPKQMGKTSLLTRILAYAQTQDFHSVFLSLQLADGGILPNLERFLQWFCARVSRQLNLPNQTVDFWDSSLDSKSNATDYFNDVLLVNCDRPLVIGIDEFSQLFAYPGIAREFLQLLRTWTEKAKLSCTVDDTWHKLRLVTVYSTDILMPLAIAPYLLSTGLVIKITEFTSAQVQDLAELWEQKITEPEIKQLITLLGGHPYRLQLAFYSLQQQTITLEELLVNSVLATTLYAEHLQQEWWNLQRYPDLLPIFTQIVSNPNPIEIEISPGSQLQKMGLVHLEEGRVSLACELFRHFFSDRLRQPSS